MLQTFDDGRADLAQERLECRVSRQVAAHGQGIDEVSDHPTKLGLVPSRHGRTDDQVVLAGVAMQQDLERRQQRDVEARSARSPEQRGAGSARDRDEATAWPRGPSAPRAAAGRWGDRAPAGARRASTASMPRAAPPLLPRAGRLASGRSPWPAGPAGRALPCGRSGARIDPHELVNEDRHRPEIADNMVHCQEQDRIAF